MSAHPDPRDGPVAEVRDLGFAYRHGEGWAPVLEGVSFQIQRGEAFGLVGESGCGKSTLAYTFLGYRARNSRILAGEVLVRGRNVLAMSREDLDALRGRRVSLVPQNPTMALSPHMRVARQTVEVLMRHGLARTRGQGLTRTAELFRLVGLPDPEVFGRRYPHQLSGGQQQRVCIAIALACDPDLVVLDEPTTGLDVTTQEQVVRLLLSLRRRLGMSMLYVTHDLGLLSEIADRVGVMYAGQMVEIASTDELYRHPRHPYTRGLIASIPRIDQSAQIPGRPLQGLLRREELPPGCPFFPRCEVSEPECADNRQTLSPVAPGHFVACQRWQSLAVPSPVSDLPGQDADAVSADSGGVLCLEGVSLSYGRGSAWLDRAFARPAELVVSDVSFDIQQSECFALVGESGSGKSTIARAVSGLLEPVAGRILFEGRPIGGPVRRRDREVRRKIQYIFQNPDDSLNPRSRVGAILSRPLEVFFHFDRAARRAAVAQALDDVRLDAGYARRYPDQLSGGERQRVAIARALIADPVLLLCDEVLSALDVSVQSNILDLFKRLRRETRVAMLFISHDLAVVRSLADRVAVLFHGHLCEIGEVKEIFTPPFHPYTYSLLMAVPGVRHGPQSETRTEALPAPKDGRGCAFAGLCPWQPGKLCEDAPPPWREAGSGLRIRCHLTTDELSERAQDLSVAAGPEPDLPASSLGVQDS